MAYFVSVVMWLLIINCANYLRKTPISLWTGWQWFFLVFTVVLFVMSIAMFKLGMTLSKEHKQELARGEEEHKRKARMHYEMTYEGIDMIPQAEQDTNVNDYSVYMDAKEGEVVFEDSAEKLHIVEEKEQ